MKKGKSIIAINMELTKESTQSKNFIRNYCPIKVNMNINNQW